VRLAIRALALSLVLAALAGAAQAQILVTTSADAVDVPMGATQADLPGPDGVVSFREALRVSDNEPGHQTIGFAIPEEDWYLPNIYPGIVLLQGSMSFSATQPVTIDGTTQTDFTGDTNPDGNELVLPLQTYLSGAGTVVTGLHSSRVEVGGSGSELFGNTGGMTIGVYTGSGSLIHDNEADTIKISYSSDNVVVRNTTARVRITGLGSASPASGNVIGGPDPADGNAITGWGNYGEHGVPGGDAIELLYTANTLIQNNTIGTTPDGMAIGNPACTVGIGMHNDNDGVLVRDNLIAVRAVGVGPANGVLYGTGIWVQLYEGGVGNEITGNTFGLDALGQPVLGGVNAVWVSYYAFEDAAQVTIGGPAPGQGNVIAGYESSAVLMEGSPGVPATGRIRLSGNAIYGNGDLGIDLMPNTWDFGPTPNDPLDADLGANGLQNYPEVLVARVRNGAVRVAGFLHSEPLRAYTLEFFAAPGCALQSSGEAQVFLGSLAVATDASGNALFAVDLPAAVPAGWFVASTATREPTGRTSELSPCTPIGSAPPGPAPRAALRHP